MGCPATRSLESNFSVDISHRDRSETFPRVRYDNLEVRGYVTIILKFVA